MAEESQFNSIDEIRAFIKKEVESQLARQQKKLEAWRSAKRGVWLLLLAAGFVQYYLIDIMYQMITLPSLQVSAPAVQQPPKKTDSSVGLARPGFASSEPGSDPGPSESSRSSSLAHLSSASG